MKRLLEPLKRSISQLVSRAIINLTNDVGEQQTAQITALADETHDDVEVFQDYGLATNPPPDSEGLVLSAGGSRSHSVLIKVGNRKYRLKGLKTGEVALYDDLGNIIKLGRDNIGINAVTKLIVSAPQTDWTGDINLTGKLTASTDVVGGGKSLKTHVHGGVQTGGGSTGAPA